MIQVGNIVPRVFSSSDMAAILENDRTLETRLARTSWGKPVASPRMLCAAVQSSPLSHQLQKLSLSKRGKVQNLSGVNVFYLHEDEYEIFFKPIASHLASLWHWGLGRLSDCQFSFDLYFYLFPFFLFFTCISTCRLTQKIPVEHDFLKEAKTNPQGENSVFYNSTNQFQQYYDNDDDNDNDNVDNDDDNENEQNKSKIAAPKNIKLPPTFRATR